jgi:hypothetical protein
MSQRLLENIKKQLNLMKLDEQDSNKALDLFVKNLMQANTDANPTLGLDDVEDEKKTKNTPEKSSVPYNFNTIVEDVINNLEGGYYHPDMVKDGRLKSSNNMGDSGETMFGMDRKYGKDFAKSAAGVEFWGIIDDADAKNKWKWNYKGGNLEPRLKELVSKMIKPVFDSLSNRYLSKEAQQIVKNNPKLTFNFAYATWNGPGWFQKFAKKVNEAVKDGVTDPEELAKVAIDARLNSGNSIIAQGGKKVSKVMDTQYA